MADTGIEPHIQNIFNLGVFGFIDTQSLVNIIFIPAIDAKFLDQVSRLVQQCIGFRM